MQYKHKVTGTHMPMAYR